MTALLFVLAMWLSTVPRTVPDGQVVETSPRQQMFVAANGFRDVANTVQGRCSMCHAREPVWEGMIVAPKGVILETDQQITAHAEDIYLHSGVSHAMPPGNLTDMTNAERQKIVNWYRTALSGS